MIHHRLPQEAEICANCSPQCLEYTQQRTESSVPQNCNHHPSKLSLSSMSSERNVYHTEDWFKKPNTQLMLISWTGQGQTILLASHNQGSTLSKCYKTYTCPIFLNIQECGKGGRRENGDGFQNISYHQFPKLAAEYGGHKPTKKKLNDGQHMH